MSFHDILRAGIRDFAEHGYDTQERLEYWADMIRRAAKDSLVPQSVMEQAVRNSLTRIYQTMVEREGVMKFHSGISRFTLEKIKPQLRAELDRRIMATANLIRLNREQMVDKTLQRFQGWATSIPAGGSDVVNKREEAEKIKKALASQTFEQRRVAIDQGHKLAAAINEIVAVDGGALAAIWHSRWRVPGYDYRPDHKERDQKIYAIRGNWAFVKGLMKAGPDGYTDEITRPAEEPFCQCRYQYLYNLRDLEKYDLLTARGIESLAEIRRKISQL